MTMSAIRALAQPGMSIIGAASSVISITYLSTSHRTMSSDPRMTTASARNWPIVISRSAERLQNDGERIFIR